MLKFSGFADLASCHRACALTLAMVIIPLLHTCTDVIETNAKKHQGFQQPRKAGHLIRQCHRCASAYNAQAYSMNARACKSEQDTEADLLAGMSRQREVHSKFYWFTEFCSSQ